MFDNLKFYVDENIAKAVVSGLIFIPQHASVGYFIRKLLLIHDLICQEDINDRVELQPHWLLIYKIMGDNLILVHTGSHTELF